MISSYPRYRAGGLPSLGDLPEHWTIRPLSGAFQFIGSGTTPSTDNPAFYDNGDLPWVNTGDLNDGHLYDCQKRITSEALLHHSALKTYPANSVVIAMYGATIGKLALLKVAATVNQACCVFGGRSEIEPRFLFYVLMSLRSHIISLAYGGGQPNISQQTLRSLRIPKPPFEEQLSIAAFLDRETAKIDALVEEQQRLIELLKEKRQAVVSYTLTKGLAPNVPRKDVEWIGEVPEHWEVKRIKNLAVLISKGTTPTTVGAEFVQTGVRFLKAENIKGGSVSSEPEFFITPDTHAVLGRSNLREFDVLVVIAGATTGKSAVLTAELLPANTNQAVAFVRCSDAQHAAFVNLWLSSTTVQERIKLTSVQSAQPNLSMEDLGNIPIPVPPPAERLQIFTYLNAELDGLADLEAEANKAIELLEERRAALISAAVTGQIDVRGLVGADLPIPEVAVA